jgi:hypothetical protein
LADEIDRQHNARPMCIVSNKPALDAPQRAVENRYFLSLP